MSQSHVAGSHRVLLLLLWAQVPFLAAIGLLAGESLLSIGLSSLLLIGYAVAGMLLPGQLGASIVVSLGLVTSSEVFRAYLPEVPLASLHFLVMVAAISLYRMWQPLLVGVVALTGYQLANALAVDDPSAFETSALQSLFAVALALILVLGWRQTGLTESESGALDRLRIAFEEAPFGMAILRPSGEVIQVNHSMGDLLGYPASEMVGRNVRSIVHSDDMAEVGEAWEEMGNSEDHSAVTWLRFMTSAGSSIWGRASLSLVPHTGSRPAMVVLQVEEATRSYQERVRLEELITGKDEFVAAVGEEIGGSLDEILQLASSDDRHPPLLRRQVRQVATIVADLIASARAETRSRPVAALPIDAETLCRDVVGSVPGGEDIVFEIEATGLWADPALTRQVLTGLVANAVRFGGSEVRVRTGSSGPDTVIEVIDDGAEIPRSDRERIFESDLQRGRPVTRPATVGLGLTVGRRLARQMDGDLTYRRTGDGRNVFELRLPAEQFTGSLENLDVLA